MYTGTLIDDLMAAVDRAEEHVQIAARGSQQEQAVAVSPALYEPALYEMGQSEQNLLGAA